MLGHLHEIESLPILVFDAYGEDVALLTIQLEPDVERRLADLAKRSGQSTSEFARQLIEQSIEDLEDIQMAVSRLEDRQPPLSAEQAREALGLDD
jgi:predicted DNA-binding protein